MRRIISFAALCFAAALPAMAVITGYVMNVDGQPIAGAKLEAVALETTDATRARLLSTAPERKALTSGTADAKGKFTLESPKDPVVIVRVTASGYAPASFRAERDEEAGALILNQADMKTGRITANGKPVAGAKVIWSAGAAELIATTDAEGRYQTPDPSKWAARVVVLHPDYAAFEELPGLVGAPRRGRAAAGQPRDESPDHTLTTGTAINGTVVAEDGKSPVPNATVAVDGWPVAASAQDGTFSIAHANSKWNLITARAGLLLGTRARGSSSGSIVVRLAKAAALSGTILDSKTRTPVAGAEVSLRVPMRAEEPMTAMTDAKGNYSLNGVVPGSYEIVAYRPGYAIGQVTVSLKENERVLKILTATPLARVTGTVVDDQKRPIAAARVTTQMVSRGEGGPLGMMMGRLPSAAASAPDGSFSIRAEGDTDIELQAVKKGLPNARSSKLRLAPGERKSGVVITIPSGIAVTGRVVDKNGKPVAGATVVAAESQGGGPANFARRIAMNIGRGARDDDQVKTAKDGTFSTRVKEGAYDFAFKADGYGTKSLRAVQIHGEPKPLEVTLEPGVEIAGRITRGGVGVEGVRIDLIAEGGMAGNQLTAPDGSFRISDLGPGQYMLNAMKQDEFIQQIRPVTAPSSDVNIDIPAGARISGKVVDKSTKQPVTAFDAGVTTPRGGGGMMFVLPGSMRRFTSDDGSFVLENVPPGQTQVTVNAPGYTTARLPNINVESGKDIADLEVDMDRGVRVTGHVTGPDGSALSGVAVRLDMTGGRMINFSAMQNQAVTDANGDYTLEAIEPGDKTLVFSRSGYLTTQKSANLSGTDARVDAQLSTGTRVSGVVVTDAGVPVPDAMVFAMSGSAGGFGGPSTRTDADGSFSFEGLTPAHYNFRASKQGLASGEASDVDVTSGAPVRIVMKNGGVVYGQVTGLTPDELQRATVVAQSPNGGASAPVDASGSFRIEGAPLGTVRVSANTGGGIAGGRSSPVQSIQIDAPGSHVQVNIAFKSDTVVSGHVTRNGQPVQGAMVSFNPRNATAQTRASTSTDSNGQYQVSGLDDADYSVNVVDIQRSAPYSTTYTVHGSGTFDVDMKSAQLRGRVIDSDGNALADALVELREKMDSGGFRMSRAVQTDATGSFMVDNVPAGNYSVSAEKQGYGTRAVDTVVNDSGGNVDITLAKNAGVTLRVVDARDGRLINASVHVTNAQGATVYDSPFFGGGSADAISLPLEAGMYSAEISAMGYAPQNVRITSPSAPTMAMTPGGTIVVQSRATGLRRARLIGADGLPYSRGRFGGPIFTIDPSPGSTTLPNIAPGTYTLQILGDANDVSASAPVTVREGQAATVSI